jgi:hypothetical protein
MHYRSLLFPGVLITAIASLLIVQSCGNKAQAGADLELERAGTLAIEAINKCYNARHASNCKSLAPHKSIIQNRCESRDRAACELLVAIQKLESDAIVMEGMEGGPTRKPRPEYPSLPKYPG